jgi:DNA topoisomerase-1
VRFRFRGKSGIDHEVAVADRRVAGIVRRCHELGGQHLFTWCDDDGEPVPVTSSDVNDALRRWTGLDVTAKDFRTWGGTVCAVEHLATEASGDDPAAEVVAAVDHAAGVLRNTRAVCRASYVHPAVLEAHEHGGVAAAWRTSRSTARHSRAERATLALLA